MSLQENDRKDPAREDSASHRRVLWVLVFLVQCGRLLLGTRRVKPGFGFCSGFGGWVEPGETPLEAARRETEEEAGIVLRELEEVGNIEFEAEGARERPMLAKIFWSALFDGEPRVTAESEPAWFQTTDLPLRAMWPADEFWLPFFLAGFHVAVWLMRTEGEVSPAALVVVRGDQNPRLVESLRLD